VCSGNQLLTTILDSLWDRTECYRRILVPDHAGGDVDPEPTHRAIAAALTNRDPAATADLLRRHIKATEEMLGSLLAASQA
jgi:DNA-binding GntR family transcriptional regulator